MARTLSDQNKIESMVAAVKDLQQQLRERNNRIQKLENLVRTLSDQIKVESMVAAFKDLQPQLREKNIREDS